MSVVTTGIAFVLLLTLVVLGWVLLKSRLQLLSSAPWLYRFLTIAGAIFLGLVGLIIPLGVAGAKGAAIAPLSAVLGVEIAAAIGLYQLWVSGQYARLVRNLNDRKRC